MNVEKLIEIANDIDHILHGYGIIVDHDILVHYIYKIIKESYPNDDIELELSDLKIIQELKALPDIV